MLNAANGKSRLGCTVAAKFSRQFSDEVSCQIVAHMLAQQYHTEVTAAYAIGDEQVTYHIGGHGQHQPDTLPDAPDLTLPFADIIERARLYVFTQFGSFEKFAEYGLIA